MLILTIIFLTSSRNFVVNGYSNKLFTITKLPSTQNEDICVNTYRNLKLNKKIQFEYVSGRFNEVSLPKKMNLMFGKNDTQEDPLVTFRDVVYNFLFGESYELFNNKSGVHLPIADLMHPGQCELNVTDDYMQTAVDAFNIFVKGDLADIERLPPEYVLNSARTISMLKISHEKLAATWNVVKGSKDQIHVTYETLEKYRPLFKYLSGKDMAELNLKDHRILNYIGTHPDLTRHQVGLVASKYIKMNKRWTEPKYLNVMNNLLCGVPITYMRDIPANTYLQLSHQVFYHTRACDPLQRRFYLSMMTRTQALGKSYSWNAQDVSRLGLLLAEVEGEDLGAIKPEALAGLTAQVVMAMRPSNLQYLTDTQMRYIGQKPFNILSKKLKKQKATYFSADRAARDVSVLCIVFINIVIKFCAI